MHLLIIAATEFEIQETVSFINNSNPDFDGHFTSIQITGIGGVATTYNLSSLIHKKKPDIILQAGIAGCFTARKSADVICIKEEIFGDLGVWENGEFKTVFDLKLVTENEEPFTNTILVNPYEKLLSLLPLEQSRAITVNEISTKREQIEWIKQKFSPVVESMEGAAFHYVCLKEHIPFLQLRSISNEIGERDKSKWKMKEAIAALNKQLILIIQEIYLHNETYFRI
jgi:futalosine hydrolase